MPISFSIAGIRTVDKPNPQLLPTNNQINQNPSPNEPNVANNNVAVRGSNTPDTTTSRPNHQEAAPDSPLDLRKKYPGSGKLTIMKKKGKTGKSIIQRVPIYNEDYDSSDEEGDSGKQYIYCSPRLLMQDDEAILFDELEAEITRQEEKELLDKWNDEILEQEEADLMKRLSINIEHAEYLERCSAKPSVVSMEEHPHQATSRLLSVEVPQIESVTKLAFQPMIGETPSGSTDGVVSTRKIDFCKARMTLPRYLDQEHKILAFTEAELYTSVIHPFEENLTRLTDMSRYGFGASLVVSSEDPFSYVLEARGPREALDELKMQAGVWLRHRIQLINSYMLLQDRASVVIESGVNPRLTREEIHDEKARFTTLVIKKFGGLGKENDRKTTNIRLKGWEVRKVQLKEDPEKCVIKAHGTAEVLNEFIEFTRNWVETESKLAHSFESDALQSSSSDSSIKKVRMTFRLARYVPLGFEHRYIDPSKTQVSPRYSNCGVWLSGIQDDTRLAFMMGGPGVLEKGCSLLMIDRNECNTPEDVNRIYSEARDLDNNFVRITVCVSRYTDFKAIPDFVNLNPRRLDGKPFNLKDYENPESIVTTPREKQQQPPNQEKTVPAEQLVDFARPAEDTQQEQPNLPDNGAIDQNGKDAAGHIRRLLNNQMSIEIRVMFSSTESLGAKCSQDLAGGGVLLLDAKENGQLMKFLGKACRKYVVLWKMNGQVVKTAKHLRKLVKAAKRDGESLNCVIVVHDSADLTELDGSMLVQGDGDNPRRRNGDTYSLKKQLRPPESRSTSITSATETTSTSKTTVRGQATISIDANRGNDDSNGDKTVLVEEKKGKIIPKKKDAASQPPATSAVSSSSKRVAESTASCEGRIPKKSRAIPHKTTSLVGSSSSSSTSTSANQSRTATSCETRPVSQLEEVSAEKTESTARASISRDSVDTNSSGQVASHVTVASEPRSELYSNPLKPPVNQKRMPTAQPSGEPGGKKQKRSAEANSNTSQPVPEPHKKSMEPRGSTLHREFEVEFPYNQPIGAFFKTEGSKCKVFSVFNNGNAKKGKIQPGSIAVAASISGDRQDISTHDELKEQYFRAIQRRSKIHIFFVNSDVVSHPSDLNSYLDWTKNGIWNCRYDGGWAGGAKRSILKANLASDGHRPRRNVTFSNSDSVKYFEIGTAPNEWPDAAGISNESETGSALSPEEVLTEAVKNDPYTKLIEVLETGITALETGITAGSDIKNHEPYILLRELPIHYKYAKKEAKINSDRGRQKDMDAKRIIIGIYRPLCAHVERAMKLEHTSAFRFQIKSVELKRTSTSSWGRTEELNGIVEICRSHGKKKLGTLPTTQTRAFISYDDFDRNPHFTATYNSHLKLDRYDYIFIEFREGSEEDAIPIASCGRVKVPLCDVHLKCDFGEPLIIRVELEPTSSRIISKGTVEIEVAKVQNDKSNESYIEEEREQLRGLLNEQISYIERFNQEEGGGRLRLSANIHSVEHATPLHAAVHLKEEGMVKRLLKLGADPHVKSKTYGTPSNLAVRLKDSCREKLQSLIKKGRPPSETEPAQQLYEMYSRVHQLLYSNQAAVVECMDEDDEYYSGETTVLSEDDLKREQFEIFQNIFTEAPKPTGGLEDGLEANKNYVSGMLRLNHSKRFPDIASVEKFIADAICRKVLVSISLDPPKYRLGAAAGSHDHRHPTKERENPLPETPANWMHVGKRVCDRFPHCRYKHRCHFVHLQTVPLDEDSRLVFESKDLLKKREDRFLLPKESLRTLNLDGWFTAGYYDAKRSASMHVYAEGGNGRANQHGVYWYPTLHDAKEALQRVLTFNSLRERRRWDILKKEKSQNRPTFSSNSNGRDQELPALEDRDWVDKEEFPRLPSDFDPTRMKNHNFWTVEARFGEAIGNPLQIFLNPVDVHMKRINGFYTLAFTDRDYNKIIYVEGGKSRINDQGVHWYSSEAEAWDALEPVVSASRRRSAAK